MIELGKYNTLMVVSQQDQGFYLEGDEEWGDILLPSRYAPKDLQIDDEIEVFVYFDSEDRIIATTQKPYATVGEFASLKVSAVETMGVFLDWGLEKDLLVPHREILFQMRIGESYAVYVYLDSSNRIAASTRITKYIDKSPPTYLEGEKVDLMPYQNSDLGVNAIINGRHSGLIHKTDSLQGLKLGQKIPGYVKKIREDGKIDLSLHASGLEGRSELADEILKKLKGSGGRLNVNAKTSSEVIHSMFRVSRNKFKIALGYLYKNQLISIDDDGISLK